MLVFIDSNGQVVGQTPGGLTQGSSKANVIQLVAPFPTAIVTLSFQLPNGVVLGPVLQDGLEEPADEYTMTKAFEIAGYNVDGGNLTVFTYTCPKQLTAQAGTLGIQFFVTVGELIPDESAGTSEVDGYTLAVPMIRIPVYNGTRFIPNIPIDASQLSTIEQILQYISVVKTVAEAAEASAAAAAESAEQTRNNAVLKNPPLEPGEDYATQTIAGNITGIHDLYVDSITAFYGALIREGINVYGAASFNDAIYGNDAEFSGKVSANEASFHDLEVDIKAWIQQLTVNSASTFNRALSVLGALTAGDDAFFEKNVNISGNLNVKGTTITTDQQTVLARDNILVTNIGAEGVTASGLVINIGVENGVQKGYGILYQPGGDAVYIGKGTITYTEVDGVWTDVEFTYDAGEALPLAARDGEFAEGDIPVWDAEKNAFITSGKTYRDFIEKIANNDANLKVYSAPANNANTSLVVTKSGFSGNETYRTIPLRNASDSEAHPGTFEVQPPELDPSKTSYRPTRRPSSSRSTRCITANPRRDPE